MAKKTKSAKYAGQFDVTKRNKIRKLERELKKNPKNQSVKMSLEHWKTVGKRDKHPKRRGISYATN